MKFIALQLNLVRSSLKKQSRSNPEDGQMGGQGIFDKDSEDTAVPRVSADMDKTEGGPHDEMKGGVESVSD